MSIHPAGCNGGRAPRHPRLLLQAASALALVIAIVIAGCGSSGDGGAGSTDAASRPATDGEFAIAYFSPIASNPYIAAFGRGAEGAAEAAGVKLTTYDANGDPGQQAGQIETAAAAGDFDGFLLIPITPAALPALAKAKAAAITSVCAITICGDDPTAIENEDPEIVASQFVIDIPEQEEFQAEAIVKACEGTDPCNVVYIPGTLVDPRTKARIEHLEANLADHPQVKLLSTEQSGEDNVAKAQDAASNLLAAYPDLDVIACSTDQCGLGAETALKKAGKLGQVKLLAATGSEEGVERVAAGAWFADAFPEPVVRYAEEATQALIEALKGKKVPATITAKFEPPVLYEENAHSFQPDWSSR